MRKLERAVGQPLLHRTATGVAPTRAGETLLPYAERILALSAQALQAPRRALTGHCGVGLIEVVSAPGPAMREAFTAGRLHLALCDPSYLPEPPRWTVRLPLIWACRPDIELRRDPLPLVLFSQPCQWRAPVLDSLEAAGRAWRIVFESTSLAGVQAAVRAGLGVAALLPANIDPGTTAAGLPDLPDVELGLVRRSGPEGDPLVDAVEAVLRRLA